MGTSESSPASADAAALPDDVEVDLEESLSRPEHRSLTTFFRPHAPAKLFALPPDAPRVRRPTDITLLILTLATLVWTMLIATDPLDGLRAGVSEVIASLPPGLDPLWRVLRDLLPVWAFVVLVLTVLRGHWRLLRDLAIGVVMAGVGAALVGKIATGNWPDLFGDAFKTHGVVDFPSLVIVVCVAMIGIASPHLARPLRYTGRWLVLFGGFAFLASQ